jgi:hypothetical protein
MEFRLVGDLVDELMAGLLAELVAGLVVWRVFDRLVGGRGGWFSFSRRGPAAGCHPSTAVAAPGLLQ